MPEEKDKQPILIPCDSSFISAFGYIGGEEPVLRVRFTKDGALVDYDLVPANVFEAMKDSPRPGKYFRDNIYRGGYGWRRV